MPITWSLRFMLYLYSYTITFRVHANHTEQITLHPYRYNVNDR